MSIIVELSDDLLDYIFTFINHVMDVRSFILLNKRFYIRYKNILNKYKLKLFLNIDYPKYYQCLEEYDYNNNPIIDEVIKKSISNIPKVCLTRFAQVYDLRFIFELMYRGYALDTVRVKEFNLHFYIHFYDRIKKCLSRDRQSTLDNVEKCSYLISLKQNPTFKRFIDYPWISIYK